MSERGNRGATADHKPVVLIGGAAGTGKTSLANRLLHRLDLDHKIGVGFLRAAIQSETDERRDPDLFGYSFSAADPVSKVRNQARRLRSAVAACVNRARAEGTSLIVEGSQLVPDIFAGFDVDAYLVLAAPTEQLHWERLHGDTHALRRIPPTEFANIRQIDRYFVMKATAMGVPVARPGWTDDDIIATLRLPRGSVPDNTKGATDLP